MNKSVTVFMDSLSDWREKIDSLEPGGMVFVADFGDPLTHPEIEELFRYCSGKHVFVSLATTGEAFELAPMVALYDVTVKYCIITFDDHSPLSIKEFIARFKTTRGQHKYPILGIRTYGKDENSRGFVDLLRQWLLTGEVDTIVNTRSKITSENPSDPAFGFKGIETLRLGPEVKIYTHSDSVQKFYSLSQEWSGLSWQASKHDRYNEDANAEEPGFAEY